jgi:hypothetical protein
MARKKLRVQKWGFLPKEHNTDPRAGKAGLCLQIHQLLVK